VGIRAAIIPLLKVAKIASRIMRPQAMAITSVAFGGARAAESLQAGSVQSEPSAKELDPDQIGQRAESLNSDLRKRVVGQDAAIKEIVASYQTYLAGMCSPGRPLCTFLFLGPTGSGKTLLVEAMAESLVGNRRAVLKIDCAEFQHSHEIAKLVGSPPGYLGHRDTQPLFSQETLEARQTDLVKLNFILFDEIEKASDALWHLLLGVLDKATLRTGDNRTVDFSGAMIFMTSNLGASEMNAVLSNKWGFASPEFVRQYEAGVAEEGLKDKLYRTSVEAARRKFTPEFMNRIDKTIVFKPLEADDLRKVLKLELNIVQKRLFSAMDGSGFVFRLTEEAKDYLLAEGTDLKYGARHLKRAIDRHLVSPLSNLIGSGQVVGGDLIEVHRSPASSRLTFVRAAASLPAYVMAQIVDSSIASDLTPRVMTTPSRQSSAATVRSIRS
jgi:ATP-dependent Clp protease ATP-binding subunit ClpA